MLGDGGGIVVIIFLKSLILHDLIWGLVPENGKSLSIIQSTSSTMWNLLMEMSKGMIILKCVAIKNGYNSSKIQ